MDKKEKSGSKYIYIYIYIYISLFILSSTTVLTFLKDHVTLNTGVMADENAVLRHRNKLYLKAY